MAKKLRVEIPKPPAPPRTPRLRRSTRYASVVRGPVGSQIKMPSFQPEEIPESILKRFPTMTYPEYLVGWALQKLGYEWGRDFLYQQEIFGGFSAVYIAGGSVADWLFLAMFPYRAVYVNSIYWHYVRGGVKTREHDLLILRTIRATNELIPCVIDEDDLFYNALWVTKESVINLNDYSRYRGLY